MFGCVKFEGKCKEKKKIHLKLINYFYMFKNICKIFNYFNHFYFYFFYIFYNKIKYEKIIFLNISFF